MTDARLSQLAVEVIRTNLAPTAQVSQLAVEVLRPNAARGLTASAGSFALTGKASSFVFTIRLSGGLGQYVLSGLSSGLYHDYSLPAVAGGFALSGNPAYLSIDVTNRLSGAPGIFTLSGKAAQFDRSIRSSAGSFSLTGQNAALVPKLKLIADVGPFIYDGSLTTFGLRTGFILGASKANLTFTGRQAILARKRVFHCSAGAYSSSYKNAQLFRDRLIKSNKGTFALAGGAAFFRKPRLVFRAAGSSYSLAGKRAYPFRNATGPFYFAWTDAIDSTFSLHHRRYDEQIFSFSITHEEGQIPVLEVEIKNPQTGLLNSARHQWAWFSWNDGTTTHPLFYGRLIGAPTDMLGEVIRLQFLARANDYLTQKTAIADSLKVAPYYDALFLDEKGRQDPDAILEGNSASWHVDRTSLDWTISDIIIPEDGTVNFDQADVFYDSVSITIGQPPLKSVSVTSSVEWEHTYSDAVLVGNWYIPTFAGDSLLSEWPQPGTSIGGGWTVDQGYAVDLANVQNASVTTVTSSYRNMSTQHSLGDTMSAQISTDIITNFTGQKDVVNYTYDEQTGVVGGSSENNPTASKKETYVYALQYLIWCGLSLKASSQYKFGETISFTMNADVQNVLFDVSADDEAEALEITAGSLLDSAVTTNWLPEYGNYFSTNRGAQSVEYLLMRARARLLTRARCLEVGWSTSFENGVSLSCRKGAQINDDRIPGGSASGKIISYRLYGDGTSGQFASDIKIGVSVGNTNSQIVPVSGVDTYAQGYVNSGYSITTGTVNAVTSADVGYSPLEAQNLNVGINKNVTYSWLTEPFGKYLKYYFSLNVPDVSSRSYASNYEVSVTSLNVPKGIDMSAAHVS